MHIRNILSDLQSRESTPNTRLVFGGDDMFIAARTTSSLSPVNQRNTRLVFGGDDMCMPTTYFGHIVPTGLKKLPKYLFKLHTDCATSSVVHYVSKMV